MPAAVSSGIYRDDFQKALLALVKLDQTLVHAILSGNQHIFNDYKNQNTLDALYTYYTIEHFGNAAKVFSDEIATQLKNGDPTKYIPADDHLPALVNAMRERLACLPEGASPGEQKTCMIALFSKLELLDPNKKNGSIGAALASVNSAAIAALERNSVTQTNTNNHAFIMLESEATAQPLADQLRALLGQMLLIEVNSKQNNQMVMFSNIELITGNQRSTRAAVIQSWLFLLNDHQKPNTAKLQAIATDFAEQRNTLLYNGAPTAWKVLAQGLVDLMNIIVKAFTLGYGSVKSQAQRDVEAIEETTRSLRV